MEFLEHYGIKGMKWGVRRFGRKLDRMNQRYNKTRERYKNKVTTGHLNEIEPELYKMTRQQVKLEKFMKKNEALFNKNIYLLPQEWADAGETWINFANASGDVKRNMRIRELQTGWEKVLKLNPKVMKTTSWDELYRDYDTYAERWRK